MVVAAIFLKSRFFLKSGFLKSRAYCINVKKNELLAGEKNANFSAFSSACSYSLELKMPTNKKGAKAKPSSF